MIVQVGSPACPTAGYSSSESKFKVAPSFFEHKSANFFVATVLTLSQENVVQILRQFTVKMLTK